MIVDDNRDAALSLSLLLKRSGHEAKTAHDGEQALQSANEWRPDVVLLDIGLPKINGYDVARKLRQQSWGSELLLVATTGWGQAEDRMKSVGAGFNAHLVKPLERAELTRLLSDPDSGPPLALRTPTSV